MLKRIWFVLILICCLSCEDSFAMALPRHDFHDVDFTELGNIYNVDPAFAKAVAILETGWFKSRLCKVNNNLFGIKAKGGYRSFSSKEASIEYFMDLMNSNKYRSKSITEIGKVYCPSSKYWARDVKKIMKMLEAEK